MSSAVILFLSVNIGCFIKKLIIDYVWCRKNTNIQYSVLNVKSTGKTNNQEKSLGTIKSKGTHKIY